MPLSVDASLSVSSVTSCMSSKSLCRPGTGAGGTDLEERKGGLCPPVRPGEDASMLDTERDKFVFVFLFFNKSMSDEFEMFLNILGEISPR